MKILVYRRNKKNEIGQSPFLISGPQFCAYHQVMDHDWSNLLMTILSPTFSAFFAPRAAL